MGGEVVGGVVGGGVGCWVGVLVSRRRRPAQEIMTVITFVFPSFLYFYIISLSY